MPWKRDLLNLPRSDDSIVNTEIYRRRLGAEGFGGAC
jgi:hypothetical protein